MKLTVVGCSGSMPGPTSPASSYLLQSTQPLAQRESPWNVLLDLGSGAFGPLQSLIAPDALDAVLISHLHADHCADITALAVWLRYGPRSPAPPLLVIGPDGTAERIAELTMMTPQEVADTFDIRTVHDRERLQIGPFVVEAHEVRHPVTAFAFRVTGLGQGADGEFRPAVLTYTGDTDACAGVETAASVVDLLLSEAAFTDGVDDIRGIHLTGSRAGELARGAGVASLVLTHIQPWADVERVRAAATAQYGGPVTIAAPGQVYRLPARP